MAKIFLLWGIVFLIGSGLYFLFEDWKKALGLVAASILIDLAIDEGLLEFEKKRGKID